VRRGILQYERLQKQKALSIFYHVILIFCCKLREDLTPATSSVNHVFAAESLLGQMTNGHFIAAGSSTKAILHLSKGQAAFAHLSSTLHPPQLGCAR